MTEASARSL